MSKKISKTEANEKIREFFSHIKHKSPEEVKKIKNLAMNHNIKLGDKRKLFCKKCFKPYATNASINLKEGFMSIECGSCGFKNRWKLDKEIDFGDIHNEHEADSCC